jgi:hypothetical protein
MAVLEWDEARLSRRHQATGFREKHVMPEAFTHLSFTLSENLSTLKRRLAA